MNITYVSLIFSFFDKTSWTRNPQNLVTGAVWAHNLLNAWSLLKRKTINPRDPVRPRVNGKKLLSKGFQNKIETRENMSWEPSSLLSKPILQTINKLIKYCQTRSRSIPFGKMFILLILKSSFCFCLILNKLLKILVFSLLICLFQSNPSHRRRYKYFFH
jgi:hypothetical protein